MKRKKSEDPSRIYTYGCLPPTVGAELFRDQLFFAHRYQNQLVEIERERRQKYREARSQVVDLVPLEAANEAARQALAEARLEIKARKSGKKKSDRKPVDPALRARATQLAGIARSSYQALKLGRQAQKNDPGLKAASKKIDEEAHEKILAARAETKAYWGSYLLSEKAMEQAKKSKFDPKFRRWQGEGRVGVQIQPSHRLTTTSVFEGEHTFFQIDPVALGPEQSRTEQKKRRTVVRLRVGTGQKRAPVWVELPLLMHRPLPADGEIKWAWILVSRVGARTRYELQVVVESKSFHPEPPRGRGAAALDLGWRRTPDGIRIGYVVDGRGTSHPLVIPGSIEEDLDFSDHLRSVQDQLFNEARPVLAAWLKKQKLSKELREQARTVSQWRSPERMVKLMNALRAPHDAGLHAAWDAWRSGRLAAGRDLFDSREVVEQWAAAHSALDPTLVYLDLWRRKNRHLYQWGSGARERAIRRRDDLFGQWAASLSRDYDVCVVEKFNLTKFTRDSKPEDVTDTDWMHRVLKVAAPGTLRGAILSAMGAVRRPELPARDSTRECHLCGHVNDWGKEQRVLVLRCAGCGEGWDQDENAGRVLLKRYLDGERSGGGGKPGGTRSEEKDAGSASPEDDGAKPDGHVGGDLSQSEW